MKLFDILKQSGVFSNDIKLRIKNNQITINSEVIKDNIELDIELDEDGSAKIIDADDFLFWLLIKDRKSLEVEEQNFDWFIKPASMATKFKVFGFENLFGSNIKNDLTDILNDFIFVRTSKKETFLLKKANGKI